MDNTICGLCVNPQTDNYFLNSNFGHIFRRVSDLSFFKKSFLSLNLKLKNVTNIIKLITFFTTGFAFTEPTVYVVKITVYSNHIINNIPR